MVKKEKPAPRPDTPRVDEPAEVSVPADARRVFGLPHGSSLVMLRIRLMSGRGGERAGRHLLAEAAEGEKHPVQGPFLWCTCVSTQNFMHHQPLSHKGHLDEPQSLNEPFPSTFYFVHLKITKKNICYTSTNCFIFLNAVKIQFFSEVFVLADSNIEK